MNLQYFTLIGSLAAWAAGGALLSSGQAYAQEQQGFQELTRGPVHEAFATTVSFDAEPGMIVNAEPPDLIEEIPPDQRPGGDNVTWISGYWGWDEEESDFLWISGIWRNIPPDRQWVPGYWGDLETGWQWTSGYWAEEEAQEVVYLPQPPKSVETGPNVASPSTSHIWVSGTWVNRESRYAWRPGYWEPGQENWTWVPAHYRWTRRGHVFVEGYWDYNVHRRGVVFAPVRFQREYYSRPNYYYTPSTVISLNVFVNHLFVRPNYGHYYFGDYYAPRYRNEGFYASFSYHSKRRGYDPIYAYSRWEHRGDRNWERSRNDNFVFYRDHANARPPRTWAAMNLRSEGDRRGSRDNYDFAQPLARYAEQREGRQRFQTVSKDNRDRYVAQRQETRKFSQDRRRMENRADSRPVADRGNVSRERLSKSPVVGKRAAQMAASEAPPKRRNIRGSEPRVARTQPGSRTTETGKGPAGRKPADLPGRGDRGPSAEPRQGRNTEQERDPNRGRAASEARSEKRSETADQRARNNTRPAPKATPEPRQEAEPVPTGRARTEPRSPRNAEDVRTRKPETAPRVPRANPEQAPQRRATPAAGESKKKETAPARRAAAQGEARAPESRRAQTTPQPAQQRQARPEPKRAEAPKPQVRQPAPAQQRQARPEPKRAETPKPQVRQQAPAQQRQARPEPKRAEAPKPQVRQPERKAERPQQSRREARPAQAEDARKKKDDEGRGKKN